MIFFILKKLFFISTHQNEPKILIWNKNNIFFWKHWLDRIHNHVLRKKKNQIFYLVFVNLWGRWTGLIYSLDVRSKSFCSKKKKKGIQPIWILCYSDFLKVLLILFYSSNEGVNGSCWDYFVEISRLISTYESIT